MLTLSVHPSLHLSIIYLPFFLSTYLSSSCQSIHHLSVYLCLSIYLSSSICPAIIYLSIHVSIYHLSAFPSIHLSIYPSIHPSSIYLSSIYLSIYLSSIYLSIYASVYLCICHPSGSVTLARKWSKDEQMLWGRTLPTQPFQPILLIGFEGDVV